MATDLPIDKTTLDYLSPMHPWDASKRLLDGTMGPLKDSSPFSADPDVVTVATFLGLIYQRAIHAKVFGNMAPYEVRQKFAERCRLDLKRAQTPLEWGDLLCRHCGITRDAALDALALVEWMRWCKSLGDADDLGIVGTWEDLKQPTRFNDIVIAADLVVGWLQQIRQHKKEGKAA